ncbi:ABC transporter permease [Streptosporangium saharense]|uniref:ABC-2 type transport system permease protein n=1 Tax=Streptosporangium saharense TaxID=1706840 RepID=A0A7W7QRL4_9ACTN|nr:ABC transporter permease [Streptosporangium saharense]MBB4917876.1 ABC-2 type transport system permease protein [Streptosporangium saharense]
MNGTLSLGVRRGLIEQGTLLRDRKEAIGQLVGGVGVFLLLALWMGGNPAGGGVSMATFMAVGFTAFIVFSTGVNSLPLLIAADREEGALLRLRALPRGIPVYVTGRAVSVLCQILLQVAVMLLAGVLVAGVRPPASPQAWLTFGWALVLGALSVVPIGAALGAMMSNPKSAALVLGLPSMVLMLISGVMIPVRMLPEVVGRIAQVFPLYWEGHALRAAFLPQSAAAAELGGTWQLGTAATVMGVWTIAGMVLAPWLLRKVTREESGTRQAERRI